MMLSEAIRRIHNEESMSFLFQNISSEDWCRRLDRDSTSHDLHVTFQVEDPSANEFFFWCLFHSFLSYIFWLDSTAENS